MATDLEKLVVSLDADIRALTNKLNRAGVEVDAFAKRADATTKRAGRAISANLAHGGGGGSSPSSGSNVLSFAQKQEFGHIGRALIDEVSAGQSPLRALQVEGARIVQAFSEGPGGVTGTFKALGSALTGLVSPTVLVAGGFAAVGAAAVLSYASVEAAEARIRLGLAGIGGASRATISDIRRLGEEIGHAHGLSASAGEDIALSIAKTGKVDVGNIAGVGGLAKGYAALTGTDLPTAGYALADIFADPAAGAEKLAGLLGTLDDRTVQYVRTLAEQGNRQQAIATLAALVAPALSKAAEQTGTWAKAWDAVAGAAERAKTAIGQGVAAVVDGPTLEQQRAQLQTRIDTAKSYKGDSSFFAFGGAGVPEGPDNAAEVADLEKQKAAIEAKIAAKAASDRQDADTKAANTLSIEAGNIVRSYDEIGQAIRKLEADRTTLAAGLAASPDDRVAVDGARQQYDALGARIEQLKTDYAAGGTAAAAALRAANFAAKRGELNSYEAGLADINHQYDELILKAKEEGNLKAIPTLDAARQQAVSTYKSGASDKAEREVQLPADFTNIVIGAEGSNASKNPKSSASGFGQFIDSTFIDQYRKEFSDLASTMSDAAILKMKSDVEVNKKLILSYARENAVKLNNAGFAATAQNLYLAHNYGADGAIKLLSAAPATSATSLLGAGVAAANPAVAGHTAADVVAEAARRSQRYSSGGQSQQQAIDAERARQDAIGKSAPDVEYLTSVTEQLNQARKDGLEVGRAFSSADDLIKASSATLTPAIAAQRDEILKTAAARRDLASTGLSTRFNTDMREAYDALGRTSDQQAVYDKARQYAAPGSPDFQGYTQSLTQLQTLTEIKGDIAQPFHSLTAALIEGKNAADALKQSAVSLAEKLTDKFEDSILSGLFGSLGGSSSGTSGVVSGGFFTGIGHLLGLAAGGKVDGPGTSTSDSIPARLSKGEFVVNAAATRRSLPLLQALNNGRRFAAGGYLGVAPIPAAVPAGGGGTTSLQVHAPFTVDARGAQAGVADQIKAALGTYHQTLTRNITSIVNEARQRRF